MQDVLQVRSAMAADKNAKAEAMFDRIVAMLTKFGQRDYAVHEEPGEYRTGEIDPDTDADADGEREGSNGAPTSPRTVTSPVRPRDGGALAANDLQGMMDNKRRRIR